MTDPIADMLTRIRNADHSQAVARGHAGLEG
jgi:ribosomal protein S8